MLKKNIHTYSLAFQGIKLLLLAGLLVLPFKWPKATTTLRDAGRASSKKSWIKLVSEPPKKSSTQNSVVQIKKANELLLSTLPDAPPRFSSRGRLISSGYFSFAPSASLRTEVDFWKIVYTRYDQNSEIIHDSENLGVVYSVLHFEDIERNSKNSRAQKNLMRQQKIEAEKTRIRTALLKLDAKQSGADAYTAEESELALLFQDDLNPNKFREAASLDRIRSQTGLKSNFKNAIIRSGAYLPEIEAIFLEYGLPIELTRMIFVESMFNPQAKSKVGAYGLWQIMPNTAKLYGLNVDENIDERADPQRATHVAAQLLAENYRLLQSWPLAINAYNSGPATLQSAMRQLGTRDIATIIQQFRGGVYGFASRNFYPSFLAALEVYNDYPRYFGTLHRDRPLSN